MSEEQVSGMGNIERENSLGRPESTTPWWLRYEGEQPLMDDLPTSSAATELERLRRQLQGAVEERDRYRLALRRINEGHHDPTGEADRALHPQGGGRP